MTMIEATIDVHHIDDVTFLLDTGEFLDAIGPVDRELEDALNDTLDAYVDKHAYYHAEQWYSLLHERDPGKVLHTCLGTALGVDTDDVSTDYDFTTANWENWLSEDFGGTLWDVADGRQILTIESGDFGMMKPFVGVRAVACEEPAYMIASCSAHLQIGCTACAHSLDTASERIAWTDLTRPAPDGWARDGLFCPWCGHRMVAEVLI